MKKPTELWIWISGIVLICLLPVSQFTVCPLKLLGITCPGCGLGSSIYYLVRGNWNLSWQEHKLALPALIILFSRIYSLYKPINSKNTFV